MRSFELTRIYAGAFSYLDDRISVSCDIISVFVNMGFHRGVVCVHVDGSIDLHCFIVYEELVPLIFVFLS